MNVSSSSIADTSVLPPAFISRLSGIYEKYFIVQESSGTAADGNTGYWDDASIDFNGIAMRGLPLAGSVQKFSFCAAPGAYVIDAIDTEGDGWWGSSAGCEFSSLDQGTLEIGDTVTGDTSESCDYSGTASNDHYYRISLQEDTSKTCSGNSVMLSSCGSEFDTVRLIPSCWVTARN